MSDKLTSEQIAEKGRRHCLFLNQCADYFNHKAQSSNEDADFQAHSNNARNLVAASNFIAVLLATHPTSPKDVSDE